MVELWELLAESEMVELCELYEPCESVTCELAVELCEPVEMWESVEA